MEENARVGRESGEGRVMLPVGSSIARGLARIICAIIGHRWSAWMPRVTAAWLWSNPGTSVDCEVGRMRQCAQCLHVQRETYEQPRRA